MRQEPDRLRRERDFYRRLLCIGGQRQIEPFLAEALAMVVELTGARRGYIELHDEDPSSSAPSWWMAQGCTPIEVENIRHVISRGIISEAIATGRTVVTSSAFLDPRFEARESVRTRHIEAVLCTPVGENPPLGVIYLEGKEGTEPWSEDDREEVELFARHLAPFVDSLLAGHRSREQADATRSVRGLLRLEGIVGRSRALAHALRQAALVAPLDVPVLLTGESGTGKSQLAWIIHQNSPRASSPFVELNCATLPEALVESELFGAREGAHSTARRTIPGKVAAAESGTLFLDEIADLPLGAQAKLLQLLQSKRYFPLGAVEPLHADVRVIAASNRDLEKAMAEKNFREDIYYRLQVLPIRLPTLAERREDLAELAMHFAGQACDRHKLAHLMLSRSAILAVETAEWPGNVRQLSHAIEAAAIRASGERSPRIERRHVFPGPKDYAEALDVTFQEATRRFQRELLSQALEDTNWNVAETARRLDLARSHVYNLISAFGLHRDT
jgi:Nif-specific regulatory protein